MLCFKIAKKQCNNLLIEYRDLQLVHKGVMMKLYIILLWVCLIKGWLNNSRCWIIQASRMCLHVQISCQCCKTVVLLSNKMNKTTILTNKVIIVSIIISIITILLIKMIRGNPTKVIKHTRRREIRLMQLCKSLMMSPLIIWLKFSN